METMLGMILDNVRVAGLDVLECKESIVRLEFNASIRRSNSDYFSRHTEDSPNPDMERIDRCVSLWFKDQADMDERLAEAAIGRLAEIVDLKQRWLALLERFENMN